MRIIAPPQDKGHLGSDDNALQLAQQGTKPHLLTQMT